jgi:hypothetical protein
MKTMRISTMIPGMLAAGALCFAISLPAMAQVQSTKMVDHGTPTSKVTVDRGEVVYVSGNDLVVKLEDGTLRHFNNVPDSVTVNVDGKALNVHQLKPGMKLERQTIVTSTPRTITTVQTVTGKVWHVNPPLSVTLTMDNGENQTFKIPSGQKFTVNGQQTDAFGLKKGMMVSAQKVTEVPETVVSHQVVRTGTMPPAPQEDQPILIAVVSKPAPPPAADAPAAAAPDAALPKTASSLPLIGLLGMLLCSVSLIAMTIRKVRA